MTKLNVIFDVRGTLVGRKEETVHRLFKMFEQKGHTVSIWTNGMFSDVPQEFQKYPIFRKHNMAFGRELIDNGNDPATSIFDIAVDDDTNQNYLAAHEFIWVHDIPTDADTLTLWFYANYGDA